WQRSTPAKAVHECKPFAHSCIAKLAQDLEIEHGVVAHQPSVQSPRLGLEHVAERTALPHGSGHNRMVENGSLSPSPIIPRERIAPVAADAPPRWREIAARSARLPRPTARRTRRTTFLLLRCLSRPR